MSTYQTLSDFVVNNQAYLLKYASDGAGGIDTTGDFDNPGLVERMLVKAYNTINRYVGGRFAVPQASPPADFSDFEETLSLYYIHRSFSPVSKAPEQLKEDYDEVMRQLRGIQSGSITLSSLSTNAPVVTIASKPRELRDDDEDDDTEAWNSAELL